MKATVSASFAWKTVTAFGGYEFTKGEWRLVPAGHEAAAIAHPYLDIEDEVTAVITETVTAVIEPSKRRKK